MANSRLSFGMMGVNYALVLAVSCGVMASAFLQTI